MRLADLVLRCLVRRRDRDTISGDLLEEYHETVLPARGRSGALLWYARQVISFVSPVGWGLLAGVALGAAQLVDTAMAPLSDDSAAVLLALVAGITIFSALCAYRERQRFERFRDALTGGILFGIALFAVIDVSSILRVNLFLDQIQDRSDWVNLTMRYRASGFETLRGYANYEYFRGAPLILMFGALIGAIGGTVGGLIGATQRQTVVPG